jgi:hypothetical protein
MTTPKQFRAYAHECLVWAEQAKTTAERDSFLKIAAALNRLRPRLTGSGLQPTRPFS